MTKALTVVGLALLAGGLLLGIAPMHAQGSDCGSAFRASSDAQVADLVDSFSGRSGTAAEECSDKRSGRQPVAWCLVVGGGVLLLGAAAMRRPQPVRP